MTTTAGDPRSGLRPGPRPSSRDPEPSGWLASVRHALDRPLTSYYLLLGASTLLLTIGLMMVLSASSVRSFKIYDDSYHIFLRQLTWVLLALPIAFVVSRLPHRLIRGLAWPGILAAIVLLALTRVPGMGVEVNGNTNWLDLGPVQIQPSELAKLAVVLWCADLYARKERLLGDWRHALIPMAPVTGVVVALVVAQKDLGTALVLLAIVLGMLWVVGAPGRLFVLGISVVGVLVLWLATTSQERLERLTNFADPFKDYEGAGWQPAHGLFAMSSGGIFGKGISASQQKWGSLPEAHTDFIFAVLGEELGLVGTLLVLALFLTIAYAGIRVAVRTRDPFVRYMAAGITIWLTVQMMINVGMVLALLPVIGIPLPLVSYGGSALLPSLVALGLLVSFARSEPGARAALRAKRRRRTPAGVTAGGGPARRGR
ncbi:MAG TPA: putative lipid II flippase FtsW [Nocardioides sp.]|uniref:putative lipid II flippase FtsW n=1 Tax=Nocardioides sp. TaxID=35761 RepID=UPI002D8049C1|nr:putative lipid II flippase FtsW [Nocardioides sp.]HET6653592.1 putative lipid II flippase FtsW [Nocardioides sp.]